MDKLIKISDLSIKLDLVNPKNKIPLNHIIRYWEREFKQINPIVIYKRRYFNKQQVEIIKLVNYLLKKKGMTIAGVKKVLNSNLNKLDDHNSYSLKAAYYKKSLREKSFKILNRIKNLRKYGKKNSH